MPISLLHLDFRVLRCRFGQTLVHWPVGHLVIRSFARLFRLWLARLALARVGRLVSAKPRDTAGLHLHHPFHLLSPTKHSYLLSSFWFSPTQWLQTPPSRRVCRAIAPSDASSSLPSRLLRCRLLFPPSRRSRGTSPSQDIARVHQPGAAHHAATAPRPPLATFATEPSRPMPHHHDTTHSVWRSYPACRRLQLLRPHRSSVSPPRRGPEMPATPRLSNDHIRLVAPQTLIGHGRRRLSAERRRTREPPRSRIRYYGKRKKTSSASSASRKKQAGNNTNGRLSS
jgi:hypothetical protein